MSFVSDPSGSIYGEKGAGLPDPAGKFYDNDANDVRSALLEIGTEISGGFHTPLRVVSDDLGGSGSIRWGQGEFYGNGRDGLHIDAGGQRINFSSERTNQIAFFHSRAALTVGEERYISFETTPDELGTLTECSVGSFNVDGAVAELFLRSDVNRGGEVRVLSGNNGLGFHENSSETSHPCSVRNEGGELVLSSSGQTRVCGYGGSTQLIIAKDKFSESAYDTGSLFWGPKQKIANIEFKAPDVSGELTAGRIGGWLDERGLLGLQIGCQIGAVTVDLSRGDGAETQFFEINSGTLRLNEHTPGVRAHGDIWLSGTDLWVNITGADYRVNLV